MNPFLGDRTKDEFETVIEFARMLPWDAPRAARISLAARDLLQEARKGTHKMGEIESFLRQYGLDTQEGIALVCLAEALLRIPDAETANALIRDKITAVNWLQARVQSSDWLVRAARFGLSLTKTALDSFAGKLGEPLIRQGMIQGIRMMGRQFVLGETIEEALKNAKADLAKGYGLSADMLGEGARTLDDAQRYFDAYVAAVGALAGFSGQNKKLGMSVKLSALHPRYHPLQEDICRPVLVDRLLQLARLCAGGGVNLTVDAEESERLSLSLSIIGEVLSHPSLNGWDGFGIAVQAYQKYAPELIDHVIGVAQEAGRRLRVRLVKGAYWDTEMKRAQVLGLADYPLFTRKANTDLSYLVCAHKMVQARGVLYPMFATHNAHTMAAVLDLAAAAGLMWDDFEFQRLQGMGAALHDGVVTSGRAQSTLYAPVGTYGDLLPYLVRRLLENGANTSFLNKLNNAPDDPALIGDPVARALSHPTRRHPQLALPQHLYGPARPNAKGIDLSHPIDLAWLCAGGPVVPPVPEVTQREQLPALMAQARVGQGAWNGRGVNARADMLLRFADMLERDMSRLAGLIVAEGKRTLADAVSEVREAVDFARYYAVLAREQFAAEGMLLPGPTGEENRLYLMGRGIFACISPWNFPLAIFVGQVCAALVSGNAVIAKPAEQTPATAIAAVDLLHQAGVPRDVLQLVVGDGALGAALVGQPEIAGVAFTGSVEVARAINRTLAAKEGPIVPLIAETGGQNAMIVDSSALLEQTCDDIIASAFGSAGQRCSALRILYVQEEVADRLIGLLAGAMGLLRLGDPGQPATDVGPVIDQAAYDRLAAHQKYLAGIGAKLLARAPVPEDMALGFAPHLYEITYAGQIEGEVFGPILHLIRFRADELERVVREINDTGYGLTFGLQTRITMRADAVAARMAAGNIYINRTMIGAVVGVQPFGGQGLSGTGPKAGGPHYLLRFAHERVVTRNTAAAGGNIALVALGDS